LLGAGGAASGIINIFLENGISISILNRTVKKAEKLVHRFKKLGNIDVIQSKILSSYNQKFCLIINSTSCSMKKIVPFFLEKFINRDTCCYDLFYQKKRTTFLEYCKKNGADRLSDGKGMLLNQAAYAFYLWYNYFPRINEKIYDMVFH